MSWSKNVFIHPTAIVHEDVFIGENTRIWHFCHVMAQARIGENCTFGQNVFVAGGVRIGNNVRVQNNVSLYEGVELEDDVFLGPSCVLTNVKNPRSEISRRQLFERTRLCKGSTIGANATLICGITVGQYAFVGAGAVVTKDVPDYALAVGTPAKHVAWMSRHGHRLAILGLESEIMTCPESGYRYRLTAQGLRCLDLAEDKPLPAQHRVGTKTYGSLKR